MKYKAIKMKITKNQLRRIIREEIKSNKKSKRLTEAELREIAPVIATAVRALGSGGGKALQKALPALKKGGKEAAEEMLKDPEFLDGAVDMVSKALEKFPDLDADISDSASLEKALKGDNAEQIGDILQQAAPEMEKAQEEVKEGRKIKITKRQLGNIVAEVRMVQGGGMPVKSRANPQFADIIKGRKNLKEYSNYASIDDLADNADDIVTMLESAMETYVDSGWLEQNGEPRVAELMERLFGNANELAIELNSLRGLIR